VSGNRHCPATEPGATSLPARGNSIDRPKFRYYFLDKRNTEAAMMTTVTSKGQVTIPKSVREAAGIKPGDKVVVRATASGGVYVGHPDKASEYEERLRALARRRIIRGITTDEIMEMSRGESAVFRSKKK
jgi:antitoxin PrlF